MNIKLNFKNNAFPYKLEKILANKLIIPGNYFKITDKQLKELKKYLKQKNISFILPSNAIIRSIRSAYMIDREIINNAFFDNHKNKIIKDYYKYKDIFKISKKYDFSPIKILKFILKNNKISSKEINKILNYVSNKNVNEIKKKYNFNNDFIRNIKKVIKNDIFNTIDQDIIKEYADAFENKLEYLLSKKLHFKYKTENDLRIEQTEKYGKPILTPDFLLLGNYIINNKKVNWIDAKNYFGAYTIKNKKNLKKQIEKYNKAFGKGAIVFSLGYSEKLAKTFENDVQLFSFIDLENI